MRVDPNNRLVADTLEGLWNDKLRQLEQSRQDYEKQRENAERKISQQQKAQILALAEDFPRLWNNTTTSDRDRMVRLILEDVTLLRRALCTLLLGIATLWTMPRNARAQQLYVVQSTANSVGEYNAATGAAINANFITGLNGPEGLLLPDNASP